MFNKYLIACFPLYFYLFSCIGQLDFLSIFFGEIFRTMMHNMMTILIPSFTCIRMGSSYSSNKLGDLIQCILEDDNIVRS